LPGPPPSSPAGGTLAAAIAAMILSGAVARGLGALLALAVARRHVEGVREQLAQGGPVLWVSTPDETSEKRALAILQKRGAKSVHVHFDRARMGSERQTLPV
jgi:hypothetical protein